MNTEANQPDQANKSLAQGFAWLLGACGLCLVAAVSPPTPDGNAVRVVTALGAAVAAGEAANCFIQTAREARQQLEHGSGPYRQLPPPRPS